MELSARDKDYLKEVHPDLAKVFELAAEKSDFKWRITEGVRTLERQKKLKAAGKSKTLRSRHLKAANGYSHAVDIVMYKGSKITWDKASYVKASKVIKEAAKELNIPVEWGGDWKSFFDGPHFQLPWSTYDGTNTVVNTVVTDYDKSKFFDAIRDNIKLTTENVQGFDKVLDFGYARNSPRNHLAYIIATAYWESATTMQPVVEANWLSENWRKKNLRYYPWHGRGLIQTTWKDNYIKIGNLIGKDLTKNPDLLLKWEYALPALFVGMEDGLYTGKDLEDYIDLKDESDTEDFEEYKNARRIVNGTDKASKIATIAIQVEQGLTNAGYPIIPSQKPVQETEKDLEATLPKPTTPETVESIWSKLFINILKAIIASLRGK
jgi:predicted chitinase